MSEIQTVKGYVRHIGPADVETSEDNVMLVGMIVLMVPAVAMAALAFWPITLALILIGTGWKGSQYVMEIRADLKRQALARREAEIAAMQLEPLMEQPIRRRRRRVKVHHYQLGDVKVEV